MHLCKWVNKKTETYIKFPIFPNHCIIKINTVKFLILAHMIKQNLNNGIFVKRN